MSFIALYAENASVVGTYEDRAAAVHAAVRIAMRHPEYSTEIGIAELADSDGHVIAPFVSASDLLAAGDVDAVTAADAYEFTSKPQSRVADAIEAAADAAEQLRVAVQTCEDETEPHDATVSTAKDGTVTVVLSPAFMQRRRPGLVARTIVATLSSGDAHDGEGDVESRPSRHH